MIKEFENELNKEAEKEFESFANSLNIEFKCTLKELNNQHKEKIDSLNSLNSKINETLDFCKKTLIYIKDQKLNLNAGFESYLDQLEKEKSSILQQYRFDQEVFINNRTKIFESQVLKLD